MKHADDNGSIPLFLAITCWLFGGLGLLAVSLMGWAFRDGWFPDSVESHGMAAVARFASCVGSRALPPGALFGAGCLLFWWDIARDAKRIAPSTSGN